MAYASKYYDPEKAHEYYMRTRELKGYEDRYGGARGNGTSAASGGVFPSTQASSTGYSGNASTKKLTPEEERRATNARISDQIRTAQNEHLSNLAKQRSEIQKLRQQFSNFSADEKRANRIAYMDMIREIERGMEESTNAYNDAVQGMRENQRGSSTQGFNEKGKAAAAYIKKKMEEERDELTKKANKEVDESMLEDVKRLRNEIQAKREHGFGASKGSLLGKISSLTRKAKTTKARALAKRNEEYKEKYISEIEALRKDQSMHSYYDKKSERISKQAETEAKYQERRKKTSDRIEAYNKRQEEIAQRKAEREALKAQRAAEKAAGTNRSTRSRKSSGSDDNPFGAGVVLRSDGYHASTVEGAKKLVAECEAGMNRALRSGDRATYESFLESYNIYMAEYQKLKNRR